MGKESNIKDDRKFKEIKEQGKLEQLALDTQIKKVKVEELENKLKRAQERQTLNNENAQGAYGTAAEPRKSLSTFLRNKNKADVSLVSILDRKAAILIRITTTLVSAIIVFHHYIDENVILGSVISNILIAGMLITLILSLLRKVIHSQDLQLGNQIRANYMISKNNGAKALMLDLAYLVFLFTFLIVAIVFLVGKFSV